VLLDIASRHPAEYIQRRLPSMYHQFKELADVDITKEPMEVGPTCHYVMGGVEVDADTQAATVPGLFAAGEVSGGMHGSNRLGGNSLSDLLVFGRRAGRYAAQYAAASAEHRPSLDEKQIAGISREAVAPFARADSAGAENAYALQQELQDCMQDLVGIIRVADELERARKTISVLKERTANVAVEGNRQYNPGWHLANDLRSLLTVAECIATAALAREESRGGHTRNDYPNADPEWGKINLVLRQDKGELRLDRQSLSQMPAELATLFEGGKK